MQPCFVPDHRADTPRHDLLPSARRTWRRRVAWRFGLAATSIVAAVGVAGIVGQTGSGAAPSGWYVATVPGTGADDVVLGSTCANALQCWAVGVSIVNIGGSGSTYQPLVETWNGTSWTLNANPTPLPAGDGGGFFDISCVNGSDCWAVGTELNDSGGGGNPIGTLIENWNGHAWSIVPSPTPSGAGVVGAILQSVSCTSASSCMAVGYSTGGSMGLNLNDLIEQWNGAAWTIVPGPPTGQTYDQLTNVQCLTADDCWAVGNAGPGQQSSNFLPIFPGGAPGDQGLIEHWDGTTWSIVPSVTEPSPNGGYLIGLECVSDTDCWASGATTDDTGTGSGILMESWDGSSWTDVSASVPPPSSSTGAILSSITCPSATQCWGVGSSGSLGGNSNSPPQSFIENWNGSAWSIDPSPNVAALSILTSVSCVPAVGCLASGSAATSAGQQQNDPGLRAYIEQLSFPPASSQGIVLAARDGGVFNYGTVQFAGSMGGRHLNAPVVGIAATPNGGYWLVASDGGVFDFGGAPFYDSMGGQHLNAPVVGIAATSDGRGYWLVAADGGVFNFGDAKFYGSMGGLRLNAPVVGIAASSDGRGYWLVAADGGVFSFGDAPFVGSAGAIHLNAPMTGMAATPDDGGYWLVGADGGVFRYGDALYLGSVPGQGIVGQPSVVGISRTPSGMGYWLVGSNGAVYTYGDATFLGAPNANGLVAPVSGISSA